MTADSAKLDFTGIEWVASKGGGRAKVTVRDGRQFRIVEMDRTTYEPHICLLGHLGYVIEGELCMVLDDRSITFAKGDGLSIPDGLPHTPHPLTEKVILFLSEEIR